MTAPLFSLPKDGEAYTTAILARSEHLIEHGIWEGIEFARLRGWLGNFRTPLDLYFAACILDSLVFRSEKQVISQLFQIFDRAVPEALRELGVNAPSGLDWLSAMRDGTTAPDPGVRIVPVVRPDDPPTKSGYYIVRQLKRQLSISERWIVQPEAITDTCQAGYALIIVDDLLGTGVQFLDFFHERGLGAFLGQCPLAFLPLVAHQNGLAKLRTNLPQVRVEAVEVLDDTHGLFSASSDAFADGVNSPDAARHYYYELLVRNGINLPSDARRGFGCLELCYAFDHATPDNSVPLLWWKEAQNFLPLFDR